ncbi:DUF4232 domain-containing protein [Streptomyces sp. NPDC048361]|uniref:DUF4232 domain-containing protein n=1 Tax=Streptomyces sp. NPDC048361 TaxID=3154720 RepID=UPI0034193497
MRVRKLTFAALAVAAGLSLTACQSDDGSTQSDPPAASNASSAGGGSDSGSGTGTDQGSGKNTGGTGGSSGTGSTGGKATSAGAGSSGSGGSAKGVAKCRTLDLNITAKDATVGGDAERTVAVEFMNSSGHDCMVSGFAGVDLKTNSGTVSAKRTGAPATPYTLKHGKSVYFGITYPANDSGGSGVRITGLVVTPPGETKPATLPWPGAASLPVTEDGGSQVKVGPMGSAGQGD